jgi:hypothetical protein
VDNKGKLRETLSQKENFTQCVGDMPLVVEFLSRMCKALVSIIHAIEGKEKSLKRCTLPEVPITSKTKRKETPLTNSSLYSKHTYYSKLSDHLIKSWPSEPCPPSPVSSHLTCKISASIPLS